MIDLRRAHGTQLARNEAEIFLEKVDFWRVSILNIEHNAIHT